MNKNRKIGLSVLGTALVLGAVVPAQLNATQLEKVPVAVEQKVRAGVEKTNTAPAIKLTGVADCILQKGNNDAHAVFYMPAGMNNPLGDLISGEDKEDGAIEDNDIAFKWDGKELDVQTPGDYNVNLTIKDKSGNTTSGDLTVKVVAPELMPAKGVDEIVFGGQAINDEGDVPVEEVIGEKPQIVFADNIKKEIKIGEEFNALEGVTATDKEDGNLTEEIVVEGKVNLEVEGTYKLVYNVEDKDGNVTAVVREIKVVKGDEDKKPQEKIGEVPVLEGVGDVTIGLNQEFDPMEGVKATDKEDGDLTSQIRVDASNINKEEEGIYVVLYGVEDSDGNYVSVHRNVTVAKLDGLNSNGSADANGGNGGSLPKTGAVAGVSMGGLTLAGIAGAILKRRNR